MSPILAILPPMVVIEYLNYSWIMQDLDITRTHWNEHFHKPHKFLLYQSSSSVPFTPCGAQGIHEELPSIAISSYPLDLIP